MDTPTPRPAEAGARPDRIRHAVALYAAGGALWILGSDWLLARLVGDSAWREALGTFKGWAFVLVTTALLWWLLPSASERAPARGRWMPRPWGSEGLAAAAVLLLAALAVMGSLDEQRRHRIDQMLERSRSGSLVIDAWLQQRLRVAELLRVDPAFATPPPQAAGTDAQRRLQAMAAAAGGIGAGLHDLQGRRLLATAQPALEADPPALARAARLAVERQRVVASAPWLDAQGRTIVSMVLPPAGPVGREVLVLHTDAGVPLSQALGATGSARLGVQALLVVRDGTTTMALGLPAAPAAPVTMALRPGLAALLPTAGDDTQVWSGDDESGAGATAVLQPLGQTDHWTLVLLSGDGEALARQLETLLPTLLAAVLALLLTVLLFRQRRDAEARTAAEGEHRLATERQRSLGLLHAVMDGAGIVVVAQDLGGRALLCSAEAARVAGLARPPQSGTPLASLMPQQMLRRPDDDRPAPGLAAEEVWHTPAGPRSFLAQRGLLRDAEGRVDGRYVVARDVTAALASATALRRSEEQLSLALHGAGLGLWDWQVTTGAVQVNARWAEMLGYRREDVDPDVSSWRALLHPDEAPAVEAALQDHLDGRTPAFQIEHRMRHRDGHWVWMLDAGRVVERDAQGLALRAVGILKDISDRRAAMEALERARAELEQRVAERTAALANATRRAESASLAKSAFLANMSHEIRTPLNAIAGLARLLADRHDPARTADRIEKIERAAAHLTLLIGDILDLSKIEAGRLVLDDTPFDLPGLVSQVHDMVAPQAEAKGLALTLDAPDLPAHVRGDPTRLRQALLNLVGNAVKFTDAGSVTVRIRVATRDATAVQLVFEVVDTGIGIAPEDAQRLFAPFEQGNASTSRRFGGTGLGLAITRRLATLMGGEVGLRSTLGHGSVFWFRARLALPAADEPLPPPTRGTLALLRASHAGRDVLVAEDDAVNQEIARTMLEAAGLVVRMAGDGEAVVAAARERAPDLVLMDLHMPRLDGLGATRRLREEGLTMPIVALTASAYEEDRQQCLAAGMDGFVAKPFDPDALYAALFDALSPQGLLRR